MHTRGKWFTRTGSLLILLGFFLPCAAVSCGGTGIKQSFSLATLASQANMDGLYLVLFGALGALGLTFIILKDRLMNTWLVAGQLACLAIGALSMIISLSTMYSQVKNAQSLGGLLQSSGASLFNYSLEFGFFVLLIGYVLGAIGVVWQFTEGGKIAIPSLTHQGIDSMENRPGPSATPPRVASARPSVEGARLEVVSGNLPRTTIPLSDNFLIGRSPDCNFQIPDGQVSRQHARFRSAYGAWFIQDQGSTTGTFVNGQRVQAIRLNSGDKVKIGDAFLVFRI